ncbi:hypothetical protein [Limnohabitans sp. Jir72]|uniref:type IV pilus modification PilV family protein n=1 Tax=Limnohabitans sp. Jir72 TaxID=1977909 RepID=UPI000D344D96|nr:hypothetical protein [Limnohabitans sp. Jir72]PUE24783.1 hypothetical protein B9Z52_16940 [Limnohabitans sp. Jir72]
MTHAKLPQTGMAMIEALVASAVLGVGMMGAAQLAIQGLQTATDTRQRLLAHGLAVNAMECHQTALRADCPLNDQTTAQASTFTRRVELTPQAGVSLVDITVTVQWPGAARAGSAGSPSQLVLRSSRAAVPIWVGVSLP